MAVGIQIAVAGRPATRLGRFELVGEVIDAVPTTPHGLRVMDSYVLSVVIAGHGRYRHADGREETLGPGIPSVVPPGVPHWYGTLSGARWTEVFAVFGGPLFDTLARVGVLADSGPRRRRTDSSVTALRNLLGTTPRSSRAAEHQLLALADWLLDTSEPDDVPGLSPQVATAMDLLADDLAGSVNIPSIAAEVGLSYDAFRRRFSAEIGQSPLAFRNARRLQAAATLLRATDMTTRQIAHSLGFVDEFHLSRRFRAHFGQPPRDYRLGN